MIAGYGKIKRHLKNIYDSSELSELSGENLLDILQNEELLKNKITTFVVLATDYAAVGQDSKLLREAMDQSSEKVNFVLIAETESLLASKAPTNKNIAVVIEKSKKSDVLKKIVDRHIMDLIPNTKSEEPFESEISAEEVKQDKSEVEAENCIIDNQLEEKVEKEGEKKIQVELTKADQLDTCKKNDDASLSNETKEDKQLISDTEQESSKQWFDFSLVELPEYKPLVLNKPEDIISYLIRKWG